MSHQCDYSSFLSLVLKFEDIIAGFFIYSETKNMVPTALHLVKSGQVFLLNLRLEV